MKKSIVELFKIINVLAFARLVHPTDDKAADSMRSMISRKIKNNKLHPNSKEVAYLHQHLSNNAWRNMADDPPTQEGAYLVIVNENNQLVRKIAHFQVEATRGHTQNKKLFPTLQDYALASDPSHILAWTELLAFPEWVHQL